MADCSVLIDGAAQVYCGSFESAMKWFYDQIDILNHSIGDNEEIMLEMYEDEQYSDNPLEPGLFIFSFYLRYSEGCEDEAEALEQALALCREVEEQMEDLATRERRTFCVKFLDQTADIEVR